MEIFITVYNIIILTLHISMLNVCPLSDISNISSATGDSHELSPSVAEINKTILSEVTIYRGPKGSFHRSHHKKRIETVIDWMARFVTLVCSDDLCNAQEMIEEFHGLDKNPETRLMADGMIKSFISLKCSEDCLRVVLHIGSGRYYRIKQGLPKKKPSGQNNRAFGNDHLAHLSDFVHNGVPLEEGFPCAHRRLKVKFYLIYDCIHNLIFLSYYSGLLHRPNDNILSYVIFEILPF